MKKAKKESLDQILDIDKLIHEPARLIILSYLSVVESGDFLFLLNKTGLTRGNLSSHLTKLEKAGFIEIRKEFINRTPHTLLKISKSGKSAFSNYRKQMRTILNEFAE